MKRIGFWLVVVVVVLALVPCEVFSQSNPVTGTVPIIEDDSAPSTTNVTGAVHTPSRAPVPGATVRIVHLATGRSWVGWTNDDGTFSFQGLPAGRYRLEVHQLGFGKGQTEMDFTNGSTAQAQLTLHVEISPADEGMAKTSADTKPPVASSAPITEKAVENSVDSKSGGESTPPAVNAKGGKTAHDSVVATKVSKNAKTSKKNKKAETLSASAAVPGGSDLSTGLGDGSSSDALSMDGTVNRAATLGGNGSFGSAAISAVSGSSNTAAAAGSGSFPLSGQGGGDTAASPKASKVGGNSSHKKQKETANSTDATEFGQGIEELYTQQSVSKASANQVHMSLTNRYDNGVWDARPYDIIGPPTDKLPSYNDLFNVRIGGPLFLPHIYDGRQHTFFFFSTQINRASQAFDAFTTVPTLPERSGDFSDRGVLLYDPASNLAGPRTLLGNGTSVPQDRMDKGALAMLPFIPTPNLPGLVDNFHFQTNLPLDNNLVNFRVLHEISPKLSLSAHYSAATTDFQNPYDVPQLAYTTKGLAQEVTLSLNQNWTPRLSNSTKIDWTRNASNSLDGFAFQQNLTAQMGIQNVSQAPVNWGLPFTHFTNFNEIHDFAPLLQKNQTLRATDNFTYVFTNNTLHAGAELRWIEINADANPAPRGEYQFSGLMTSQLDATGNPLDNTGFDFADFLLGLPTTADVGYGLGGPYTYLRSQAYNFYVQDDWRIRPRFAVNFGVRYELQTAPYEVFNRMADLVMNNTITAAANVTPGEVNPFTGKTMARSLVNTNPNNWGPRIGIAWRPNIKFPLVVRAGYGIFYNESIYNQLATAMAIQPPFANAQTYQTSTDKLLTLENSFSTPGTGNFTNTVAVDPNYRVGSAQLWNVSLESQIQPNLVVEVNYNGTKGTHLDMLHAPNRAPDGSPFLTDPNRRIPDAGGFIYHAAGASSIYQGVQFIVRRQTSHGLILQANYSYSKSLDNASSIILGTPVVVQDENNLAAEWGRSDFDIRQTFGSTFSYDLPFGPSRRYLHEGWLSGILRDLKISGVSTITTGMPFTARVLGNVADNTGTGVELSQRADQIGNAALAANLRTPLQYFNTAAFTLPATGLFGDAARNTIPGPGFSNLNLALAKKIKFGEGARRELEWRWEVTDAFNTPGFLGVDNVVNSATFGQVLRVRNMRSMDMYIKVTF